MNAVILPFDSNKKQSVICERNSLTMKCMGAVESDSVKSARKAKDMLHKACERASETRERTLHGQEQNNAHGKNERVTKQFLVNRQVQSHALLRRGFGTSVPFITLEMRPPKVKCILMSHLRLRMVRPWPNQPEWFRRLWKALVELKPHLPSNAQEVWLPIQRSRV